MFGLVSNCQRKSATFMATLLLYNFVIVLTLLHSAIARKPHAVRSRKPQSICVSIPVHARESVGAGFFEISQHPELRRTGKSALPFRTRTLLMKAAIARRFGAFDELRHPYQ